MIVLSEYSQTDAVDLAKHILDRVSVYKDEEIPTLTFLLRPAMSAPNEAIDELIARAGLAPYGTKCTGRSQLSIATWSSLPQAEGHRSNETITRLLQEIHALHNIGYHTWRLGAEQYFVYPDNPLDAIFLALRVILQQGSWLSEMIAKIGGRCGPNDGQ